jgi:threonine/homoserine/homoserine lactone efflux protein
MPDLAHWSVFFSATIVLLLVPGPSVMFVLVRAIEHGYRGALFPALGLALGDFLQVLFTAAGLSALSASSAFLYTAVKYVGVCCLLLLGVCKLIENARWQRGRIAGRTEQSELEHIPFASHSFRMGNSESMHDRMRKSLVVQGFLAVNPKTALFFLALLPQFVAPAAGPAWLQLLLLGSTFVVLGFFTNFLYGCIGARLGSAARGSHRFQTAAGYASGVTLVALGLAGAFS